MDKYAFKREVRKLLKEHDRMDAYVFCWSDWVVHETTAQKYVDSILESHPEKVILMKLLQFLRCTEDPI